jgi:TrmH family RNA methyltransferase
LDAGADLRFVVTAPRLRVARGGRDLASILEGAGIAPDAIGDADLTSLADTEHPQGVLAVFAQPEFGPEIVRPRGRYVVLDGVQDPGNVGTLIRGAVAFEVDGVVALDGTADPWGTKAVRASAGMVFRKPVVVVQFDEAMRRLAGEGVPVLVADPGGTDVTTFDLPDGWALVVGNEGAGPRREVQASGGARVSIPMPGPAESLNVGVAGAILLYALTQGEPSA